MAKQERVVVEGEIVTDSTMSHSNYRQYTQKPADTSLAWVWVIGIVAAFLSFIPLFGLSVSILAFAVHIIKKVPPILPIFGMIIGTITTSLFLLLWLVLKAIF
jgi:hypothetical protein